MYLFQFFQPESCLFYIFGKFHFRKALKIQQAGIFPPDGIIYLNIQAFCNCFITFCINIRTHLIPCIAKTPYLFQSRIILITQFFPQRISVFQFICPRNMVKPKQKFFGACIQRSPYIRQRIGILRNSITTCTTSVKAKSFTICPMIIRRKSVGTCPFYLTPRFWSVMMSPRKYMV